MTEFEIRNAVTFYKKWFIDRNVVAKRLDPDKHPVFRKEALSHCFYLLPWVEIALAEEGSKEYAVQTMAYIRGILLGKNVFTEDELESHFKPVLKTKDLLQNNPKL